MRDFRANVGTVVRDVAHGEDEAIITDHGREIAAVISISDYRRFQSMPQPMAVDPLQLDPDLLAELRRRQATPREQWVPLEKVVRELGELWKSQAA